jgi:mono/diheme cytochrome c family protein
LKRFAKLAAVSSAALLIVVAGAVLAVELVSRSKIDRVVAVRVPFVPLKHDTKAAAAGKYLFDSRGCADCHGENGQGKVVIDDPNGLYVRGPNITIGAGSVVEKYNEMDWVRAIRHGVKPSGRPLIIMPSEDYNRLTDDDLANLVAYIRQLPPQPGGLAEIRLPLLLKAIYAIGLFKDSAEKIDHSLPPSSPIPVAATVEHGAYVANSCIGCHGPSLAGGKIPGAPPDWPPAANLTAAPGSGMEKYSDAASFAHMMRTGARPDGSKVSGVMPFSALRNMNDVDLTALYLYLKSRK